MIITILINLANSYLQFVMALTVGPSFEFSMYGFYAFILTLEILLDMQMNVNQTVLISICFTQHHRAIWNHCTMQISNGPPNRMISFLMHRIPMHIGRDILHRDRRWNDLNELEINFCRWLAHFCACQWELRLDNLCLFVSFKTDL